MAITLRHDAAAVALPSSSAQRKYGQQLVLQQQQQKYQGQQAGYDRLFDAYKQQNQNAFAWNQAADNRVFQAKQQQAQNNFLLGRDQAKFDQQQQQQEAARRQGFMEEARKLSSGMIMEDIKNGDFDPVTASKLKQNLVDEAEALGNKYVDATQRAEALQKIRAERTLLTANRLQKPPPPPPQPNFHTDQNGNQWVESGPGKWEQVPQEKSARPLDFNEYYNAEENKGKFDKDLDATMQSMQDAADEGENPGKVTEEAALEEMKRRYGFRQKALGLVGDPTAAPSLPGQAPPTAGAPMQSILEQPTAPAAGVSIAQPDPGLPPSPVPQREPMPVTSNSSSLNPEQMPGGSSDVPLESTPGRKGIIGGSAQEETGGITIESASEAAQQYEAAAQAFQELQPKMQAIGHQLTDLNSGPWSTNKDVVKRKKELKEEKKKLESLSKQYQESMKAADETAKGYYDQEIAKQPAVKNLSKAGKRPQDFAKAEFQLQNLRKQYPDMGSMPAEAKKQLIEAMAVIQAGR